MTKIDTQKKSYEDISDSPLLAAIEVIGGKWKTIILYMLYDQTLRFGELKKSIPKITQKMLTQQLRELEADGLVTRVAFNEIPPKKVTFLFTIKDTVFPRISHPEITIDVGW